MDPSERAAALDKELAVVQDAVRKAVELRGSVRSVLDSWAAVHSSSERKEEASAELRELVGRVQEAATALQEVTGSLSREVDPRPSGAPKVAVSQQVVVASEEETGAASVLKEMHERCGLAGRTFRKMVTQRFPDLEREMWLWKRDLAWKTELVKRKMETKDEGWLRLERGIRQVCERSGEDLEICKDVLQMGDACRLRGLTVRRDFVATMAFVGLKIYFLFLRFSGNRSFGAILPSIGFQRRSSLFE